MGSIGVFSEFCLSEPHVFKEIYIFLFISVMYILYIMPIKSGRKIVSDSNLRKKFFFLVSNLGLSKLKP